MRSIAAVESIFRRSGRNGTARKAALVLRIFEVVACVISFSVMAADRTQGWSGDSFDRYKEGRRLREEVICYHCLRCVSVELIKRGSEIRQRTKDQNDDDDFYKSRDYERWRNSNLLVVLYYWRRDYDNDRDDKPKHRSRSCSKPRSDHRSGSRSPSRSKIKRTSGFDMAPPVALLPNNAAANAGILGETL